MLSYISPDLCDIQDRVLRRLGLPPVAPPSPRGDDNDKLGAGTAAVAAAAVIVRYHGNVCR